MVEKKIHRLESCCWDPGLLVAHVTFAFLSDCSGTAILLQLGNGASAHKPSLSLPLSTAILHLEKRSLSAPCKCFAAHHKRGLSQQA